MDQVKKNAYWIACGVVALLAGVFYLVAVAQGTNAEIEKQTRKLKAQVAELEKFAKIPAEEVANPNAELPMPVEEIAKYWQTRRESLQNELDEILKKYRSRDREFERLFKADRDNKVDYTEFVTQLRKNLNELKEKHKALLDGAGADKVFPIDEPKDSDGDEGKARAQKQYNIAKAVAESASEVGKEFERDLRSFSLTEMSFKEVTGLEHAPKGAKEAEVARVVTEVHLKMPFPAIAKLVSKLLRSSVLFELRELHVEPTSFTLPEFVPFQLFVHKVAGAQGQTANPAVLKGFDRDVFIATSDQSNPAAKGKPPELGEQPVGVKLVLHAIDFHLPEPEKGK